MSDNDFLVFPRGNDVKATFTVSDVNTGLPVNLTGYSVIFLRKVSRYVLDSDPSVVTYPADTSQNPAGGQAVVSIPAADNQNPGITWCRLDVVLAGKLRTANWWQLEIPAV